jgi:hypothetical protein
MKRIVVVAGLLSFALSFRAVADGFVFGATDGDERDRLDAASGLSDPWLRYVALNHDWSPGAWCVVGRDERAVHTRWAREAASALDAAVSANDPRARAYLFSAEGAWFCLDRLREQHPKDPAVQAALLERLQQMWPDIGEGAPQGDRARLWAIAEFGGLHQLQQPLPRADLIARLQTSATRLDEVTNSIYYSDDYRRALARLMAADGRTP